MRLEQDSGSLHTKGGEQEQGSVKGKTSGDGCTKAENAETKPIHGCEPAPALLTIRRRALAAMVREPRPKPWVTKNRPRPSPEAQIRRSNNPKILRANALDLRGRC